MARMGHVSVSTGRVMWAGFRQVSGLSIKPVVYHRVYANESDIFARFGKSASPVCCCLREIGK